MIVEIQLIMLADVGGEWPDICHQTGAAACLLIRQNDHLPTFILFFIPFVLICTKNR
jgi:hypothetical protein